MDQPERPATASTSDGTPEAIFTPAHRLALIQMETRRAIAQRTDQATGRADSPRGTSVSTVDDVPVSWRLVPETVQLHAWQREALPVWLQHGRGTVKVATGGGKTVFALAAAERLQTEREPDLRLVVVVPTIPLMHQWRDELRSSNLPEHAIGLMGGGEAPRDIASLRVLICVLNSARDRLPDLVRDAGWSPRLLLVVDECHRAAAAQARRIFEAAPRYTLGLSATPEPDLEVDVPSDDAYAASVIGQALGPIVYDFTLAQSQAAGLLTPFEIWHVGLPLTGGEEAEHDKLSREISELRKDLQMRHRSSHSKQAFLAWCQVQAARGGPAAAEAERFIGLANQRKRLLYRADARRQVTLGALAAAAADPDARAIVFHESIDEIEALYLSAIERGLPVVLEHSQLADGLRAQSIDAFREGVARGIISAKSLVEGFNVPSADLGIIAASSGSVRQRIQSLGRLLRRKSGGREARVIVLYVRDTEDERIYEKADWAQVVGAKVSRYFTWDATDQEWTAGLKETPDPPRVYRPPSWEVDVGVLEPGDPYPGSADGQDVRVDQQRNLRGPSGALVRVTPQQLDGIVESNPYGRARITPAGHLIVRTDRGASPVDWRYLGTVNIDAFEDERPTVKLKLLSASGRRVIGHGSGKREVSFALGSENGGSAEAGRSRDQLLVWIARIEADRGVMVRDLFWDGKVDYWVEVNGERLTHARGLAPLEFRHGVHVPPHDR
jgi:superfamily II DNA or RNA helicase